VVWSRKDVVSTVLLIGLVGCGGPFAGPNGVYPLANLRAIEDDLAYRSSQPDENMLRDVIAAFGIETVINLRGENPDEAWWQDEDRVCVELGVELINIPMSANHMPSNAVLLSLYDALTTAEHPIWLHCQAGADRSGAAAAIWRMSVLGQPRDEAAEELNICYGHIVLFTPRMDYLVSIFQPDPDWIVNEYDPDDVPF
jgi:protein tyrosine phosphatase (PTP) superfamily phosphohydrolase (DUF442 family)